MDRLKVDLGFLLNQTAYSFAAHLGAELGGLGISVRDFCVLMKAAEGERTQNAVAEAAALDKTTMVATLDHLERAGLAERRVSSTDRRARVVAVTPKGRRVLDRAYEVANGVIDDTLSVLDPSDREALVRSLTALADGPLALPLHTQALRRKQSRPAAAKI